MSMYSSTITIFNYDYASNEFYSTVITNVECQYDLGISRLLEYNVSADKCLLIIKFSIQDGYKTTEDGKKFLEPVDWRSSSSKSDYFTFQTDKDFFTATSGLTASLGSTEPRNERSETITEGSNEVRQTPKARENAGWRFEDVKNSNTNKAFLINEYREYDSVIPHWEVYGG